MPQVDLETLVSACASVGVGGSSDRKIACETLAHPAANADEADPPEIPPDFPPESFWLSKDAELDWFDRNAFIERKDSTKGASHSTNLNPNLNPNPNHSQRFSSIKPKANFIGLPQKPIVDTKCRRNCKPGHTRLFPKRSGSSGKSDSSLVEPASPKVSCMGRVRSKRDRNRRLRNRQRSKRASEPARKKEESESRQQKTGFFASFRAIFRPSKLAPPPTGEIDASHNETPSRDIRDRLPAGDRDVMPRKSVEREPAGLGGMKRFASGRRSAEWASGIDVA